MREKAVVPASSSSTHFSSPPTAIWLLPGHQRPSCGKSNGCITTFLLTNVGSPFPSPLTAASPLPPPLFLLNFPVTIYLLSIDPSILPSIYLFSLLYLSIYLSIYLSTYLPIIYLSISIISVIKESLMKALFTKVRED